MKVIQPTSILVACALVAAGCGGTGGRQVDAGKLANSFKSLNAAEESYKAKKFAEALPVFDEVVKAGGLQADVLADVYLKRACCKLETGDVAGATEDLAQAERGGAVGEEYQASMKRLSEKKSGS